MADRLLYLDSSALVKLVLPEPESDALIATLGSWSERVSSVLAAVEVLRAARRASASALVRKRAERVISRIHLVPMNDEVLRTACGLHPSSLRTLDAIHVASALTLGRRMGALIAYDLRLIEAARQRGITVLSPE